MMLNNGESRISSKKAKSKLFTVLNLPEEIVEHILVWLPVLSLLKFKCVCRSWYSLISSKHFIQAHLRISKEHNNFRSWRVFFTDKPAAEAEAEDDAECQTSLKHCSFLHLLSGTVDLAVDSGIPMQDTSYVYIVGACNGLICVLVYFKCIYLCNPSTRDIKELPDLDGGRFSITKYGFGFDDVNEDYKVVCVMREDEDFLGHVVKVYSLTRIIPKTVV